MPNNISIFDPTAPDRTDNNLKRRILGGLQGKVVGFIDNSKPNFNHLVDDLSTLLQRQYGVKSTIKHSKSAAGKPASDDVMKDLARQCDLVITGSGD